MWQKGEIACFEQFLLLSLYVFKKPSAAEVSESVYMEERVNMCLQMGKGYGLVIMLHSCIKSCILFFQKMETDEESDLMYKFDLDLDLDSLIQSTIEDLCNPDKCTEAKEWDKQLTKKQPAVKLVESKSNKLFSGLKQKHCQIKVKFKM